jgi:hypothetical protein
VADGVVLLAAWSSGAARHAREAEEEQRHPRNRASGGEQGELGRGTRSREQPATSAACSVLEVAVDDEHDGPRYGQSMCLLARPRRVC